MARIPLKQMNAELRTALANAGFEPYRRAKGAPLAWAITAEETRRTIFPPRYEIRVGLHYWRHD